jgi:hypothetical protein
LGQVGEERRRSPLMYAVPPELKQPACPVAPRERAHRWPICRVHLDPREHDQRETKHTDHYALLAHQFKIILERHSVSIEGEGVQK